MTAIRGPPRRGHAKWVKDRTSELNALSLFDGRNLKLSSGSLPTRADRFGYIDCLRGIAALLVIYLHLADHFLTTEPNLGAWDRSSFVALTEVIDIGKSGVIVFFAISGYVIPFSLMKPGDHAVQRFVVGRFFRLYPAYWLSLPAGLAILLIVLHQHVDAPLVVANVTMLQQFFGIENILGIYWTLQIELIFYALCVGLFVIGLLQKTKHLLDLGLLPGLRAGHVGAALLQRREAAGRYSPVFGDHVLGDDPAPGG
jgi:peptidoglycan/LPS O-acetylase OafA/YrhL